MGKDYSSARPEDGRFDKTRWSMVFGTARSRAPYAQKTSAELCGLYWRPLYAFARRRGRSPEDAQDMVRDFFKRLTGTRSGTARHFMETLKILIPRPPKSFFEGSASFLR
jgi:hypothetical protein